jgi:two-component system response regulator NreC
MTAHLHLASHSVASPARAESPIEVVLADDHTAVRRSLRLMLEREDDVQVIAVASDLSGLVRHVHRQPPRVLILDLRLPNGSSLQAIQRLRAQLPQTEIVVTAMEDSPIFAQRVLDAGAIGFVLTDRADVDLLEATRCAARGDEYVSPRVAARLDALRAAGSGGLTPRETEVLRLIALGHTNPEIAAKLHLSRRTVETHRARIHRKLGLATRAELVQYALGRRLIGA